MKYKAIFFDRDGTLTYFNPEKEAWRDNIISEWSGKQFELPYEKMTRLFDLASEGRSPWYKTVDDERDFFRRFYRHLLIGEGVTESISERAEKLFSELWCNNDRALFSETVEVLEYFKSHGYKMGVISDTSPSLKLTLERLGIAEYFTSFTASSLVGAGKPSPIIFNAALSAQGVSANESLYVDDYKPEADGAREQGFTSFLIDRSGESSDKWSINNLKQLIDFAEKVDG
ncbi:MAG: HAD-IA family hydrolase [Clostridiales bacterium]|nr:HAD-IA family hydrolase [Clostridiales bacterium]